MLATQDAAQTVMILDQVHKQDTLPGISVRIEFTIFPCSFYLTTNNQIGRISVHHKNQSSNIQQVI